MNVRTYSAHSACQVYRRVPPCYALVWEGAIGVFYEIDSEPNMTLVADVLSQAGYRYGLLYGLASRPNLS
jgi:hypothetical protein